MKKRIALFVVFAMLMSCLLYTSRKGDFAILPPHFVVWYGGRPRRRGSMRLLFHRSQCFLQRVHRAAEAIVSVAGGWNGLLYSRDIGNAPRHIALAAQAAQDVDMVA